MHDTRMFSSLSISHSDVIMSAMASQITGVSSVYSTVRTGKAQIKENMKAPRDWPLCGEFIGDPWFPAERASNAENVSIWWPTDAQTPAMLRHQHPRPCLKTFFPSWKFCPTLFCFQWFFVVMISHSNGGEDPTKSHGISSTVNSLI